MVCRSFSRRRAVRGGASSVVLAAALVGANAASAQTAATSAQTTAAEASDTDETAPASDVVVTGSRINTAGFDAPTPTTVLSQAELRQGGRTDIQQALGDLPQVRLTTSEATNNNVISSGVAPADIRGLGAARTLVLVNGRRYISSGDLQSVPYSLVSRIDVVTGGASAAWGSDAVSGVINIVLNDKLNGVSAGAQMGISSRGDGAKRLFEGSFGTDLTDRWHFMIGGDYLDYDGIQPGNKRLALARSGLFPSTVDGKLYPTTDIRAADRSDGGLIVAGPAAGLTFNNDGSLRPFVFGRRSGLNMVGGEGFNYLDVTSLLSPIQRANIFGRTSYEVSDNLKLWVDGAYNKVWNRRPFFPDLGISGVPFSYSINNPYLTSATRAQLVGLGVTSTFNVTRIPGDIALVDLDYDRQTYQVSAGFDGNFGDGKWRYSGFYSHGKLVQDMVYTDLVKIAEFRNAIDAVRNPAGQIVCRVALTDPTTPCRPLNLFGQGNADPAAIDYITDDWRRVETDWLDNAGLTLNGEPFTLWNGKPVSIAVGVEYRKQAFQQEHNAPALAQKFALINGVQIPKTGNNVKEAFAEVAIPVLAELPFAKELTFNGAARVSDYSTANKAIWSWKLGGTWQVIDDIKFRVTRSRDIRAPSLRELYAAPGTLFQSVVDIGQTPAVSVNYVLRQGGNLNLRPEEADTLVAGVVLTPTFVPGLRLSADYYDIRIDGAITTLSGQQIVNACYVQSNQNACAQVVRNSAGQITDIYGTFINLATYKTKGIDFEAAYRTRLDRVGLPGQLAIRALANYVDSTIVDNGVVVAQGAGYSSNSAAYLTPRWRANASVVYEDNALGADVRVRYIDKSRYAPAQLIANLGDFTYASRTYVDLSLRAYIPFGSDNSDRLTIYGTVANLFDRQAPLATVASAYYDEMGRYFTVGARVKF